MKKLLVAMSLTLLLAGCGGEPQDHLADAVDVEELVETEGVWHKRFSDEPYTGWVKYVVEIEKDDVFEKKDVVVVGRMDSGLKQGLWRNWYSNGVKRSQGHYEEGKKEGAWFTWNALGSKMSQGHYKEGLKEGTWILYDRGVYTETYKNGRTPSEIAFQRSVTESYLGVNDDNGSIGKIPRHKEISVSLTTGLREKTLTMTLYKIETKSVTIYLTNQKAFQGQLIAKALNDKSQEIGRAASTPLNLGDLDAKNISFKFDGDLDETLVTKYIIELKDSSGN